MTATGTKRVGGANPRWANREKQTITADHSRQHCDRWLVVSERGNPGENCAFFNEAKINGFGAFILLRRPVMIAAVTTAGKADQKARKGGER